MPYNPQNFSGGPATGVFNGTDINVTKWEATASSTNVDVTTTGDYDPTTGMTFGRDQPTMKRLSGTVDAFVDGNNYVFGSIREGTIVSNVVLTMYSGKTLTMPLCLVESIAIKPGGVAGVQSYTISFKSNGPYSISS